MQYQQIHLVFDSKRAVVKATAQTIATTTKTQAKTNAQLIHYNIKSKLIHYNIK